MIQQGLKHFTEIPLTLIGMMLFFGVYIAVLTFVLSSKKVKQRLESLGNLPLQEDSYESR